ncbi:MAG: HAD hydrolase family protein [Oscillospiraceae bacterium]|nr:HAD hydrolase family protein [Oscillospiraceae bacterium]
MEKKLIFLDIDGTLTVPGKLVPPESAQKAIREARARGHKVFLCTGRNYAMLKPVMAYGFDGVVASAGGYVLCNGQVLYDHPMSHEMRDRVMDVLAEAGFFGGLETKNGAYGSEDALRMLRFSENTDSEAQRWKQAAADGLSFSLLDEYDGAPVYNTNLK